MGKLTGILFICLSLILPHPSFAVQTQDEKSKTKIFFHSRSMEKYPRKFILPPLFSLILPGSDQYWEQQWLPGISYTAGGLAGLGLIFASRDNGDSRYRNFGFNVFLTSGSLSAYHAFRTSLESRKAQGEFNYVMVDERPNTLLFAPFDYHHLQEVTTWAPLAAGLVLFLFLGERKTGGTATLNDLFYAGTVSYMNAVGEEALFRGWVLPVMKHYIGVDSWSIGVTAALSSIYHGVRMKHWVSALALGAYLGWLAQRNNYSIAQGIFIHTWWDVIAFMSDYAYNREQAFLSLPPIVIRF